jgi:hypothetical protein
MWKQTSWPLCALLFCLACSRGGHRDPGPDDGLPTDGSLALDLGGMDQRAVGDLARLPSDQLRFGPAATYPAGQFAYHFAVGRINNDDDLDLVVSGRPEATVYLSRGDGTLAAHATGRLSNWQSDIADMNGDGKGDLLLTDTSNSAIAICLGKGDGTFSPPTLVRAGGTPQGVAAADLNGDSKPDVLAVDQAGNQLLVFLGQGDGNATPSQKLDTGRAPLWVTAGDLNRDGRRDAVVVNLSSASFTVFLGNGDGTFAAGREVKTMTSPVTAQLADLDLDGDLDIALNGEGAERGVFVHLGDGLGGFAEPQRYALSDGSGQGLTIADLNRDGYPDLIATCAFTSPARVFLGAGAGRFLGEKQFPGATKNVFNAAALDLNRDGLPDLALSEGSDRKISVLLNTTR